MNVILFGSGNVATHLGKALQEAGHSILQVWSRSLLGAQVLADKLGCEPHTFNEACQEQAPSTTDDSDKLCQAPHGEISVKEGLLCIISVKDDAIAEVARRMMPMHPDAIWVHTAGSVSIETLRGKGAERIGVLYPMQTFSKEKPVDFNKISIFVEGIGCTEEVKALASTLTSKVYEMDGEGRRYLHLSAVFCCNFVNHCYTLSETVLRDAGIPFEVMLPLIDETADKVHHLSPRKAQTGPAARHDHKIMESQRAILEASPKMQQIYDLMSESIEKSIK